METSKKEDIHVTIKKMQEMISNIKMECEDWLNNIFLGWGLKVWLSLILKTVLWFIFIIVTILIVSCLEKMLFITVNILLPQC